MFIFAIVTLLCVCGGIIIYIYIYVYQLIKVTWNIYELRNGGAACRNEGGKSVAHETEKKKQRKKAPLCCPSYRQSRATSVQCTLKHTNSHKSAAKIPKSSTPYDQSCAQITSVN